MSKLIISVILLGLISCVSNKGPEETLRSFVNNRFVSEVDKEDFKKFFAGELLSELEGMDEEAIKAFNSVKGQKKKSFKVNFKRCSDDKCFLTYTLVYDTTAQALDKQENERSSGVTVKVKKIAELRKIEQSWKIFGISDIKTLYDYKSLQ